eukprot:2830052-Karenia_brevis.AAC.1
MRKCDLIAEAKSKQHWLGHYPQNPYCPWCREANMLRRRFARTGDREDDGLKNVTKPGQMYPSDHLIVVKAKEGTDTIN